VLEYIIYGIAACTMQLIVVKGFKNLTEFKEKIKWKYLLLVIPFAFIMTVETYYNLYTIHTITSFLFYMILYYLIFRKNISETVYYSVAIWFISVLFDYIMMIISKVLPTDLAFLHRRLLITFFYQILLFQILKINKVKEWLKKLYEKIKKAKFPYLQIILIFFLLLSLGFTIFNSIQNQKINDIYIVILSISVPMLMILYLHREYNNYSLKETNNYLLQNNEFYLKIVNDYRMLKHNIIHQLTGIKSVSNKKVTSLIEDIILQYNEDMNYMPNFKKMPSGISGIIYEKIYDFNNKEIRFEVDNTIESSVFDSITSRSYNLLCEALGILLDNALQATAKTEDKILMIDMRETEKNYSFRIINTFQEILDIENLGSIKYTTKDTGHGIGLYSLFGKKKIKIKTSIINDLFFSEIIVIKKSN